MLCSVNHGCDDLPSTRVVRWGWRFALGRELLAKPFLSHRRPSTSIVAGIPNQDAADVIGRVLAHLTSLFPLWHRPARVALARTPSLLCHPAGSDFHRILSLVFLSLAEVEMTLRPKTMPTSPTAPSSARLRGQREGGSAQANEMGMFQFLHYRESGNNLRCHGKHENAMFLG